MLIWIVTDSKYPDNSALSERIQRVAQIAILKGNEVCVFSRSQQDFGLQEGVPFYSMRGGSNNRIFQVLNYEFAFQKKMLRAIEESRPDILIVYTIPTNLMRKLIALKEQSGYQLYCDCVEWYSKKQFTRFSVGMLRYRMRDYWMRELLPQNVRVIAISQYLTEYFIKMQTPCFYLPAVCNVEAIACHKQLNRQRKVIVYAGSPGKKDLFEPIMKAIKLLSDVERKKLTLRIIGASKEQIAKNANMPLCELEKMADVLVFVPRMSHEGVMEQLTKAHFVILLRPAHMRYAKAGFPTKVPESLATGTPVICNLTSDLGMFLRDGENALIADDEGVESVLTVLRRAINVDEEQMIQMCAQARATAEEKFDYRLYAEGMGQFINHEHEA